MTNPPDRESQAREVLANLTRPIIGIENRTAQEAFDIMADRIRGCSFANQHSTPAAETGALREAGEPIAFAKLPPDARAALPPVPEQERTVAGDETDPVVIDDETAAEIAVGERARIVAWLRDQVDKGADIALTKDKGSTARASYGGGSYALKRAADLIEADEHHATTTPPIKPDEGE